MESPWRNSATTVPPDLALVLSRGIESTVTVQSWVRELLTPIIRQLPGVTAAGSSTSLPFMKRTDQAVIPYFTESLQALGGQMASANSVLLVSAPGFPDLPFAGGTLVSFGGFALQIPVTV